MGLTATVSGGVAPSPSTRFKQTKPAVVFGGVKCVQRHPRHRDVADLGAGDSDGRACPRDQRPVVGKEGGGPGCDPGGGGRGGEGKALQPDTAASTWLEHLSDTES